MEDFDPDLTLNPVILAKMEFERNKHRAAKGKAKGRLGGGAGPGALARLGLRISRHQGPPEPAAKAGLKTIDAMIHKQVRPAPSCVRLC